MDKLTREKLAFHTVAYLAGGFLRIDLEKNRFRVFEKTVTKLTFQNDCSAR